MYAGVSCFLFSYSLTIWIKLQVKHSFSPPPPSQVVISFTRRWGLSILFSLLIFFSDPKNALHCYSLGKVTEIWMIWPCSSQWLPWSTSKVLETTYWVWKIVVSFTKTTSRDRKTGLKYWIININITIKTTTSLRYTWRPGWQKIVGLLPPVEGCSSFLPVSWSQLQINNLISKKEWQD